MRLALLGPPGSGKSTQAERLSRLCGLCHVYPGSLLRREAAADSPFAARIRTHLKAGLLVPSDIVLYLIERELALATGGYVLDGFPRTIEQALELEMLLHEREDRLGAVINLLVADEESIRRLTARGRPDDTPDIIAMRLRVFRSETDPVLEFYREKDLLVTVSGHGTPDEVTDRIMNAILRKPGRPSLAA